MKSAKVVKALMTMAVLVVTAASAQASDQCELSIDSNDKMRFDKEKMTVDSSCDEVTVTLTHSGSMGAQTMGHNWVLTAEEDMDPVVRAGNSAGADNDYVESGDDRVLAYTEIIGGGEETSVTFDLSELDPDGNYVFFCSFPGHASIMKGSFEIE